MKTVAVFGNKEKNDFLMSITKVLNLLGINLKFVTEESIVAEKYFDYIILFSNASLLKASFNCGFCFIDMDESQDNSIDVYGNIIAIGFGSKNTVTISSVENENDGFVYCLQRYLNVNAFRMLEPQEIPVNVEFDSEIELYVYMICITIALIEGVDSDEVEEKLNSRCFVKNI